MNIDCGNIGVAGYYTFLLNGEPVFEAPSKNLITNFGWTRISNLTDIDNASCVIQVGTSNTPPTTADTALGALLYQQAFTTTTSTNTGTDTNGAYTATRCTFTLPLGAVVGNVAEVGFKFVSADASLSSRSLVKDGLGNPAVIVVTAADQLTILYELRYYRAALDIAGTVLVNAVSTSYVLRTSTVVVGTSDNATRIGGLSPQVATIVHYPAAATFGAPGTAISGAAGSSATSNASVVSKVVTVNTDNTIVTFTTPTVATGAGNPAGGVSFMDILLGTTLGSFGSYGKLKMSFSPAIPKDNTKTLNYSLSFTFTRL